MPAVFVQNSTWSCDSNSSAASDADSSMLTMATELSPAVREAASSLSHTCQALDWAKSCNDLEKVARLQAKLDAMGVTLDLEEKRWTGPMGTGSWRHPGQSRKRGKSRQTQQRSAHSGEGTPRTMPRGIPAVVTPTLGPKEAPLPPSPVMRHNPYERLPDVTSDEVRTVVLVGQGDTAEMLSGYSDLLSAGKEVVPVLLSLCGPTNGEVQCAPQDELCRALDTYFPTRAPHCVTAVPCPSYLNDVVDRHGADALVCCDSAAAVQVSRPIPKILATDLGVSFRFRLSAAIHHPHH